MTFGDESVFWLLLHANEYAISLNSQDARAYDLYAETSIWGGMQEASRSHLGGIQEESGRYLGGTWEAGVAMGAQGHLGAKMYQNHCVFLFKVA